MTRFLFPLIVGLLAAGLSFATLAVGESDAEILRNADRSRGGGLPGIVWTVDVAVQDKPGAASSDERTIQIYVKDAAWSAEFMEPKKIRGQRLVKKGTNMWFMSPGLQKPVPISQRQRLTGGAANGDIASTNYVRDYIAKRVQDETIDGVPCYVFELTARDKSVTYDRVRYWVSQRDKLGVRADFLTSSGKLLKTARFEYGNRINYEGRSIPFISRMKIEDALQSGKLTTLSYSRIAVSDVPAAKLAF